MRRLYSTFAGSWPGIGLLLMRLVIGPVVFVRAAPHLWTDAPLHVTLGSASVAGSGLLLFAGLWTPVAGAVVALIEISQMLRVDEDPLVSPVVSSHRRRSGDVGAGALVDRRSTLRMEAHRAACRKNSLAPGLNPERHARKGPRTPPCRVVVPDPIQSSNQR